MAQYLSLSRHVDTGITGHDAAFSFGPAAVAAARFRRWSRVQAEVAWANGMVLSRFRHEHSENASVSSTWGGGWLTHLMLQADIRLTRRASLAVRYFTAGEGLVSDHWNVAIARGSISAGVVYAK